MSDNLSTAVGANVNPPENKFTNWLSHVLADLGKNGIFIALIAVVALFTILTNGILLRPQNISNLVVQNGYILVLAIGMVMVIIAGHIDLSVGSVAAFVGACSGVFAVTLGPALVARGRPLARSSARSSAPGRASGSPIVGIPAFIVTLAGMLIFRGLALVVLGNAEHRQLPHGVPRPRQRLRLRAGSARPIPTCSRSPSARSRSSLLVVQQLRTRSGRQKYGQEVEPLTWFVIKLVLVVGRHRLLHLGAGVATRASRSR